MHRSPQRFMVNVKCKSSVKKSRDKAKREVDSGIFLGFMNDIHCDYIREVLEFIK